MDDSKLSDLEPDPRPTEEDRGPIVPQADQSKFMVYMTLGLFGFIILMAIVMQLATRDR